MSTVGQLETTVYMLKLFQKKTFAVHLLNLFCQKYVYFVINNP